MNPFSDEQANKNPGKIPALSVLTMEEAALENVDAPDEVEWGRKMLTQRKEFIEKAKDDELETKERGDTAVKRKGGGTRGRKKGKALDRSTASSIARDRHSSPSESQASIPSFFKHEDGLEGMLVVDLLSQQFTSYQDPGKPRHSGHHPHPVLRQRMPETHRQIHPNDLCGSMYQTHSSALEQQRHLTHVDQQARWRCRRVMGSPFARDLAGCENIQCLTSCCHRPLFLTLGQHTIRKDTLRGHTLFPVPHPRQFQNAQCCNVSVQTPVSRHSTYRLRELFRGVACRHDHRSSRGL